MFSINNLYNLSLFNFRKDNTGALFCYVGQEARNSCNDVRPSQSQQGQFYSYQACATPTRNTCIISFYNQEKLKFVQKTGQYNPRAQNCLTNLGGQGFGGNQGFGGSQGGFGNGGFNPLGGGLRSGNDGKGSGTDLGPKDSGIKFGA